MLQHIAHQRIKSNKNPRYRLNLIKLIIGYLDY